MGDMFFQDWPYFNEYFITQLYKHLLNVRRSVLGEGR